MIESEETEDIDIKISFNKKIWNTLPGFMQKYILSELIRE